MLYVVVATTTPRVELVFPWMCTTRVSYPFEAAFLEDNFLSLPSTELSSSQVARPSSVAFPLNFRFESGWL